MMFSFSIVSYLLGVISGIILILVIGMVELNRREKGMNNNE